MAANKPRFDFQRAHVLHSFRMPARNVLVNGIRVSRQRVWFTYNDSCFKFVDVVLQRPRSAIIAARDVRHLRAQFELGFNDAAKAAIHSAFFGA